jgi:hypothetical protein
VALAMCMAAKGADFEVRGPAIDVREFESDFKLAAARDARGALSGGRSLVLELEYGVNEWWSPAVEGEWSRGPGSGAALAFEATTFESRFHVTPHGVRWVDVGFFVEVERGAGGGPHAIRAGPLLREDIGPTSSVLNLFAVREWGEGARSGTTFMYAWQTRWLLSGEFQPGVEVYGGALDAGTAAAKQQLGGPALFGAFDVGRHQDLRYEIGYLRGLDRQTPRGSMKLLIAYEYRFE